MTTRNGVARRVLRIGVASSNEMKARSLAIARGELEPAPDEPKIWFPSAETFGKVLSSQNRELLARIRAAAPQSLQALADLTGREVSNLSRTLKTMELYGTRRVEARASWEGSARSAVRRGGCSSSASRRRGVAGALARR